MSKQHFTPAGQRHSRAIGGCILLSIYTFVFSNIDKNLQTYVKNQSSANSMNRAILYVTLLYISLTCDLDRYVEGPYA